MKRAGMKLKDMGTTGLVDFVASAPGYGRRQMQAAIRIIKSRYKSEKSVAAFRMAVRMVKNESIAQRRGTKKNPRWEPPIDSVADLAVKDWYKRATRAPYEKYFLYWRPARKGERMSLPIIDPVDSPLLDNGYTKDIPISTALTMNQVFNRVRERMRQLPILEAV